MGHILLVVFSFFSLVVQAFALPIGFNIRSLTGDQDDLSASVIEGIIIGIVVLIAIPVLWYCYKLCHRNPPTSMPLFASSPPVYIQNTVPNHTHNSKAPSFAERISLPHRAHTKVNSPTSRGLSQG